ncbi:DEKNAAC105435 [Brettanomyces naardenensis]|uniref:DEKNAAC105435 n=1 Tax=Brettanomyces naardenensis TaxID=13370 RepID=A0A448YTA1_BRENA|nr:DEKNAAC105435 [Brettanomyces naardenensis]
MKGSLANWQIIRAFLDPEVSVTENHCLRNSIANRITLVYGRNWNLSRIYGWYLRKVCADYILDRFA